MPASSCEERATEAALTSLLEFCEEGIGWYRVLPISPEAGFVEYVKDAETLYEIGEMYTRPEEMTRAIHAMQTELEAERKLQETVDRHESPFDLQVEHVLTPMELTPLEAFLRDHNKGDALVKAKKRLAVSMGVWFTLTYMLGDYIPLELLYHLGTEYATC